MRQELDQAARRRPWKGRDEFGRLWESTVDIISQGTCAPINPYRWSDPLDTPQKYLQKAIVQDPDTGQLTIRIIPALEAWARDLEAAHKRYDEDLYRDAMQLFGEQGPDAYEQRKPALIAHTGQPPQALEPLWAALDGDEWALGLSDKDVNNIRRFFPRQESARERFLRERRERDELDARLDLEEAHDPEATGGKREPVRGRRKQTAEV